MPPPPASIPQTQLPLPISVKADGAFFTLRQLFDEKAEKPTPFGALPLAERARIGAARIAAQAEYEIVLLGVGVINQARALQEVAARSEIGQYLLEVERRLIERLVELAEAAAPPPPPPPP